MSNGLIAGIIGTIQVAILFFVLLVIYAALSQSPLGQNPQAQAVLESGQQATINAFNWWNLAEDIADLVTIIGIIFGIFYLVIKVAEGNSPRYY